MLVQSRGNARGSDLLTVNWLPGLAWIACLAMLLLIGVGGLVTGFRAGMAVPDWPNTFGSNMFLYPLAEMTGGVFYEHAHRLLGSLVGLTTLALAILVTLDRRSLGATVLVWTVGTFVAIQGVMGGIRVTENSPHLAVVHGFFAHVVLAGMVGVAVLLARRCALGRTSPPEGRRDEFESTPAEGDEQVAGESLPNETDCFLATLLVLIILGQTLLGTLVRQMDVGLMVHISVAMVVAVLAIVVGVRLWGLYPQITVFARGGVALIGVVILQIVLGGISLVFRTPPAAASPSAEELRSGAGTAPGGRRGGYNGPSDDRRRAAGARHTAGVLGLAADGDAGGRRRGRGPGGQRVEGVGWDKQTERSGGPAVAAQRYSTSSRKRQVLEYVGPFRILRRFIHDGQFVQNERK